VDVPGHPHPGLRIETWGTRIYQGTKGGEEVVGVLARLQLGGEEDDRAVGVEVEFGTRSAAGSAAAARAANQSLSTA
jgi:hypothetical protein